MTADDTIQCLNILCDKWYARVEILRELGVESILARGSLMMCIAEIREIQRKFEEEI